MTEDPFTVAIHGDSAIDDGFDLAPPIHVSSSYERSHQDELVYRRNDHITTHRLEAVLGALEGGEAVVFPSGMSAVASLLRYLRPARVGLPSDVYHGTRAYVSEPNHPWEVLAGTDLLEAGDLAWIETPSNPKCLITDVSAVAAEMRDRGVTVAVDSTFATPVLQQPLALGADYVMHSSTKYIGGHSDAMGGVIVTGNAETGADIREARVRDGSIPGSLDVWLTLRGIRTLPLRIHRQCETAAAIAEWLVGRMPQVWYPGLPDHPGHDVVARQMRAGGAIVSFELQDAASALRALSRLQVFMRATSLGGVESLVEHRRSVNPTAPEGLLRLSVGLEAPQDLINDLDQALTG